MAQSASSASTPSQQSAQGANSQSSTADVVNLDELLIRFSRTSVSEPRDYEFEDLAKQGANRSVLPVGSNLDYPYFRQELTQDFGVPPEETLYPRQDSNVINITDERTATIAMTQVQGSPSVNLIHVNNHPTLVLSRDEPTDDRAPIENTTLGTPGAASTPRRAGLNVQTPSPPGFYDISNFSQDDREEEANNSTGDGSGNGDDDDVGSDDGYDDGTGNNNDVMNAFQYSWAGVDDPTWERVCRFFSCDENVAAITLEGIGVPIEPYQALAIYKALAQVDRGVYSFILGDDVGLGKTGVSLCIAIIFYLIMNMWDVVRDEWRRPPASGNLHHLPEGGTDQSSVCPTQTSNRVQCPCVPGSLARRLVLELRNFPTVIIAPPSLIPSWYAEAEKFNDTRNTAMLYPMMVHVAHSSFQGEDVYLNKERARYLLSPIFSDINGHGYLDDHDNLNGNPGILARHIILVSQNAAPEFLQRFRDPGMGSGFAASLVILDEFHNYRGARGRITGPFRMLEELSANPLRRGSPTFAIGVSGSARSDCAHWLPFIRHAFQMNARYNPLSGPFARINPPDERRSDGQFQIAGLGRVADFQPFMDSWAYLVENLNNTTLTRQRARDRDARQERLFGFLRRFIPEMMISRSRGDRFRNQIIVPPGSTPVTTRCDMVDGTTYEAFRRLRLRVRGWLRVEHRTAVQAWEDNGRRGDRPTRRRVAQDRLEDLSEGRNTTRSHSRHFQIATRASGFPAIALLLANLSVPYSTLLARDITPIATRISSLLQPGRINDDAKRKVLTELESSPLWAHRDLLYRDSQKHKEVERIIDEHISISRKSPDNPSLAQHGRGPSDGTTIRHALVLSDNVVSAFLTMMLLVLRYQDENVVLMYAHGGVDTATRQRYVQYIQRDCVPDDPVKILISTVGIMGHGFNIFRASTVILTEVPRNPDLQRRAFGTVDRRGQVMIPKLIQLYDGRNPAEVVRQGRNDNRTQLAQVGNPIPNEPLADLFGINDNEEGDDNEALGVDPPGVA